MEGCRRRGIRTRSDTSKRTGDNSRDFSDHGKIESLGSPVAESIATEWTDEKHSLYLNSMEASFVDQLYHSMDLHGRSSQKENRPDPNSSGQFKVLRGGCWQKINFERAQCQFDIAGESRVLLENPWIQHFRSAGKCQNVASDLQENGALRNEAMHLREKKIFSSGLTRSSKQVSACYAHFFHQDSVDSNTEVSDQNFVDEEHEGEKLSSLHRAKRAKTAVADASIKDQVVPNGKSPITAVPTENYASPEKEERVHSGRQSEDIDSFVCPESEPKSRLFLNQELKEEDSNA